VVRMPEANGALGPSDVKVVSVDSSDLGALVYKEAWVDDGDEVEIGEQCSIRISSFGEITIQPGTSSVNINKPNGGLLMQIQMDNEEEAQFWQQGLIVLKQLGDGDQGAEAREEERKAKELENANLAQLMSLRTAINDIQKRIEDATTAAAEDGEEEDGDAEPEGEVSEACYEPERLPSENSSVKHNNHQQVAATFQQKLDAGNHGGYKAQIEMLVGVNKQQEATIERLTNRLEHSLTMLQAVHEVYGQQRSVLQHQQREIEDLKAQLISYNEHKDKALKEQKDNVRGPAGMPDSVLEALKRTLQERQNLTPAQTPAVGTKKIAAGQRNGAHAGASSVQPGAPAGERIFAPAARQPLPTRAPVQSTSSPNPLSLEEMLKSIVGTMDTQGGSAAQDENEKEDANIDEDGEGDEEDLASLLQQVETLKSSIAGLEKLAGAAKQESESLQAVSRTRLQEGRLPKIEEVAQTPPSGAGKLIITKIPSDDNVDANPSHGDGSRFATQEDLAGLGENLRHLEEEKANVQKQLKVAQEEQYEMMQLLEEMKTMMYMQAKGTADPSKKEISRELPDVSQVEQKDVNEEHPFDIVARLLEAQKKLRLEQFESMEAADGKNDVQAGGQTSVKAGVPAGKTNAPAILTSPSPASAQNMPGSPSSMEAMLKALLAAAGPQNSDSRGEEEDEDEDEEEEGNGEENGDGNEGNEGGDGSMNELFLLLQQVETLRSSLDGLEGVAGAAQEEAEQIRNGSSAPETPKDPNPKIEELPDVPEDAPVEQTPRNNESDAVQSGLEQRQREEVGATRKQLQEAQDEQRAMVQLLGEMKAMLGNLGGGVPPPE